MRVTLPIFICVLFFYNTSPAQEENDLTRIGTKIYLYSTKENITVVGKITDLSVIDLQLMNFRDDRFITFEPSADNLFIDRFGNSITAALFDYEYLVNEIYPGKRMVLHFYLPQYKNITPSEVYFMTYNSGADTLMLAPTMDEEIKLFVKRFEKREEKKWYWKLGQATLFAIAAILWFRLF